MKISKTHVALAIFIGGWLFFAAGFAVGTGMADRIYKQRIQELETSWRNK